MGGTASSFSQDFVLGSVCDREVQTTLFLQEEFCLFKKGGTESPEYRLRKRTPGSSTRVKPAQEIL